MCIIVVSKPPSIKFTRGGFPDSIDVTPTQRHVCIELSAHLIEGAPIFSGGASSVSMNSNRKAFILTEKGSQIQNISFAF